MPQSSKIWNRTCQNFEASVNIVSSEVTDYPNSCLIFSWSHFPSPLWAEDSVWDVHQPPAGQNPRRDGWPREDRGQCDGWPDHGGWLGWPRVPPPQDTVLPVHQSGSQRAEREGHWMHCPGTEELRGGRRTRDHSPQNNIPCQTSLIRQLLTSFSVNIYCFGLLRSSWPSLSFPESINPVDKFLSLSNIWRRSRPSAWCPTSDPTKPQIFELLLLHIKMIITVITIYSIISIILKWNSEQCGCL